MLYWNVIELIVKGEGRAAHAVAIVAASKIYVGMKRSMIARGMTSASPS